MITQNRYNLQGDTCYQGMSYDEKPSSAPVNSLFLEFDTNKFYYFNGFEWIEVGSRIAENSAENVSDFLAVAQTYLEQTSIEYNYDTTVLWTSSETNGIDCSTYVNLCLMGYSFEETPYYTHNYISPSSWVANTSQHSWAINLLDYTNSSYIDNSNPTMVRMACQIGRWFYENGRSIPFANGFADVMAGDLVFYARRVQSTGKYFQQDRWMHINHVAVVLTRETPPDTYVGADGITRNWDKVKYPYKHVLIDVGAETPPCTTMHWLEQRQEDPTNVYANNCNTVCLICRPNLGE